jgi:hypothetical protein
MPAIRNEAREERGKINLMHADFSILAVYGCV